MIEIHGNELVLIREISLTLTQNCPGKPDHFNLRRKFTKEQKLEIVNQSMAEDISIESLAEQYKIHSNSIYKWRRQYLKYEDASFPGNGNKMMSP